jgi:hypothetical protein
MWNNVNDKMPDKEGFYLVVITEDVASKLRGRVEISDCYKTVNISTMKEVLKFQDYVTHWDYMPELP